MDWWIRDPAVGSRTGESADRRAGTAHREACVEGIEEYDRSKAGRPVIPAHQLEEHP